ncbi:MAG: AMP-binding protein [Prolixibacteraceae bacterium]|nr:AMP-binding protein [Prolixibacteraceae bacterium]
MTLTDHIILNNQQISSTVISEWASEIADNPYAPEWEKDLFLFLNEWFSDSDYVLAQTSGSTGEPKPIELPKSVMIKSAERTIEYFGLKKRDRLLLSLPCLYIAGKMMVVRAIIGQMNLVTIDPSDDFEILMNENFDFGAMVPNQISKILEIASGKEKLENIRNLLIGGSSIPATLETQISRLKSHVVSTYGMTETASHIAIRELSGEKRSDIYDCLPGISVTANENDCLQIHVPEINEPIQTNDIAELLSLTTFRILGRADDAIISGGIKYFPETIEKKLVTVIEERFVISSLPDEKLGEKLVLVLEEKQTDIEPINQTLKKLLPPFERPKAILFLEKFPETSTGKIKRNEIKGLIRGN